MLALVFLGVMLAAVIALPLLLLQLVFKIVFGLIFLPFKLLGVVFRVVFGVLGIALRVLFTGVGLVFAVLAAVFFLVLLPLLPFALLGLGLWLVFREARPRRALHIA